MKKSFLLIAAVLFACIYLEAKEDIPIEIPRFTQSQMDESWYNDQAKLWEKETKNNSQNAFAWFNYYKAVRYAGFFLDRSKEDFQKHLKRTTELLEAMGKALPESFEYNYCMWWNAGNNPEYFKFLEKAFQIKQDFKELSADMIVHYELEQNIEKRDYFINKYYETKLISPDLLWYNLNVLNSLEKNAVLITGGDNDTYPVWMLQVVKKIRPDVCLINNSLFMAAEYREKMMKKYGLKGDLSLLSDSLMYKNGYAESMGLFIKSIAEQTDKPIYIALTADNNLYKSYQNDLYLTGLAYKYSSKRFDNIAVIKKNWELFSLDYLETSFYNEDFEFNADRLPMLNLSYVTPALQLIEHYKLAGDLQKASQIKNFALRITKSTSKAKEMTDYLNSIILE